MNKDIKELTKGIGYCILTIVVFCLIKINFNSGDWAVDFFVQKVSTVFIWCVTIIMLNNYLLMLVKAGIIKNDFTAIR